VRPEHGRPLGPPAIEYDVSGAADPVERRGGGRSDMLPPQVRPPRQPYPDLVVTERSVQVGSCPGRHAGPASGERVTDGYRVDAARKGNT